MDNIVEGQQRNSALGLPMRIAAGIMIAGKGEKMEYENANRVFLLGRDGKPLMPCRPRKARLLLKSGKAFVVKKYPFTIQLKYGSYGYKQKVSLGVDTGQRHIGFAVTSQDKVLHQSEVELRQDVHTNLYTRKIYRRGRRNRKTRYRQARFLNRVHGKRDGLWLPPSVKGKASHNIAWIKRYLAVLPNPDLHIEVGKFDMAKMVNPAISGKQYQEGSLKDWKNYEYYVLARDKYTCQLCHKHGEGVKLVVHHIVYRSQGGTDRVDNLITLCTNCHTTKNHQPGGKLYKWMKAKKKVTKQLKGATFMNILRKRIMIAFPEASYQYGYQTFFERKKFNLPKGHFTDAIAISGIKSVGQMPETVAMISQFRKKKRSLHEATARKGRKEANRTSKRNAKNTKYARGLWLNDYVHVIGTNLRGYVQSYLSKGAYVRLSDGLGNYVIKDGKNYISTKLCKLITHNGNWQKAEQKLLLYEFK